MTSSPPIWLHHEAVLAHDIPGHPERPARIVGLEAEMARHDWFGWRRELAPAVERLALQAVHPESHIAFIEGLCAQGGGYIDGDTAVVPETWEALMRAAGAAVALTDALLGGEAPTGFSATRPPGHHAEPERAMGFCYFDFVAAAARQATRAHGLERVLILDWDVHHGNGTNEIFRFAPDVLFASIHQSPLYPGSGPASDLGSGEGEGYTVNLPVPPGAGDAEFRSLVEHVVVPLVLRWEPQLVLVSAGFDAHADDPLASCRVSGAGFAAMAAAVRGAAEAVGAPLGFVLEGGYSVPALASSVAAMMPVLDADSPPAALDAVAVHPLAQAAQRRLAPWWPGLERG